MTPRHIHAIEQVLTVNRDSVEMMKRRGVDPLDVHDICVLAIRYIEVERIVIAARKVREHWRAQDGINAAIIDELCDAVDAATNNPRSDT